MSHARYFITASVDKFAAFQVNVIGGIPVYSDDLEFFVDLKDGGPHSAQLYEIINNIPLVPNPAPEYAEHAKCAVAHWASFVDEIRSSGPEYRASATVALGLEISLCIESEYNRHNPDLYIE